MTAVSIERRRLRVPRQHGEALIEPPLSEAGLLLQQNRQLQRRYRYDLQGIDVRELASQARRDLLLAAQQYTARYRNLPGELLSADDELPIVLAGHQPQLYHAGVWLKNFALHALGQQHRAVAVNLLIDNDLCSSVALRVPGGTLQAPHLETIAMDRSLAHLPYEERSILDLEQFAQFGSRVEKTISSLVPDPLIRSLWPHARAAAQQTPNLGLAVSQARHQVEQQCGLETLELPLAQICDGRSFRQFVCHLLSHLGRLHHIYNDSLRAYRRVNRIRSHSHPAPALGQEGEWREAPFWIWSTQRPERRRLFVREQTDQLQLTDRADQQLTLEISAERDSRNAVEQLEQYARRGIRIRPRAMITTMFARLFLGDLFLHGIGGAKYDELTDLLIRRFFGFEPPSFLVLTATCLLPVPRPDVSQADLTQIDRQLRELRYHPEQHLTVDPLEEAALRELIRRKEEAVASNPPKTELRNRHQQIEQVNQLLQPYVEAERQRLVAERERIRRLLPQQKVLGSREYSFCLFPESTLRPLFAGLLGAKD